ncbi:hypothetical protein T03_18191 [Trichinella britovi]|uniref:Uncharacterized protein n=1 Tax=Trichinella britovi TaxID=45882 RepID=A0A0V1C7V7_TRIBR|nr:hypothetical protein T03_18191 [Trichinella britovi]
MDENLQLVGSCKKEARQTFTESNSIASFPASCGSLRNILHQCSYKIDHILGKEENRAVKMTPESPDFGCVCFAILIDKLLEDDVNDYEALKADLKKMFILLKSEMLLPAVVSERTNRRFCYQSPRGGRIDLNEVPKYQTVLMAVVEKEPTTMDEAQRITWKTILIEEASYSMDFRNKYPYDRRMEELTAALACCVEGATKISLSEDTYHGKHQATIEARFEKLEECCMRPLGNQTTRERLQPLRFLDGSSRKGDDTLALAIEVVIDDTTITKLKIKGFSIQFLLDQKLLFQPYPKRVWDKLDINDQDDIRAGYGSFCLTTAIGKWCRISWPKKDCNLVNFDAAV